MRATLMYGAGDVRVETVPDPTIQEPTDAHRAHRRRLHLRQRPVALRAPGRRPTEGARMGHEFVGIVEETGSEVTGLPSGDFVIAPFVVVRRHLRLLHARACRPPAATADSGAADDDGGQGEAVRVPQADRYPRRCSRRRRLRRSSRRC